ncbi:MAG: FtsW/RodA/SpoVE family cell cycle protein, partial [Clostridia bacterium]
LIALPVMIIIEPYRLKRLTAFINPWETPQAEGYQLIQSYYALGSGGFFGVGLQNSRQQYLFLPFSESDFILSIIGEETGYFGCLLLMAIFFAFIYFGIKISASADTRLKCYLSSGITLIVAIQTVVNIAVVSGTIPPTGLPLPFVSAGGSSLVAFLLATGLLAKCSNKDGVINRNPKNNKNN